MKTFLDILFEHNLLEASPVRKKINKTLRKKRHLAYLRNKAKLKMKQKRFRKSSSYKRYKTKKKLLAKRGLTARGKRIKKFI